MPTGAQVKLLRTLERNEVRRLGDNATRVVDVRVVAATHRDLIREVAEGRFREDLYYRLNVVQVDLPPLRERKEDILMLSNRFLSEAAKELGYPKPSELTTDALDMLHHYTWRGNIRELRHALKGAALRAAGRGLSLIHI